MLADYGVALLQFTADNNEILPGATPLHLAAYYGRVDALRQLLALGLNVNIVDRVNGQTALHVAVVRSAVRVPLVLENKFGDPTQTQTQTLVHTHTYLQMQSQLQIIGLLRHTDVTIRDKSGNTALSYARNADIREALVNPALDVLTQLAVGNFKDEEKAACEALRSAGVLGVLRVAAALDIAAADGSVFGQALLHSNAHVCAALHALGVDVTRPIRGVSAAVWAAWLNNPRIKALLPPLNEAETALLARLRKEATGENAQVLFLGARPLNVEPLQSSGIVSRMDLWSYRSTQQQQQQQQSTQQQSPHGLAVTDNHTFRAKLQTFALLASAQVQQLGLAAKHIFSVCIYANNAFIFAEAKRIIGVFESDPAAVTPVEREKVCVISV